MSYPITRIVVKDNAPQRQVMTIGRIHTEPQPVFATHKEVSREARIAELEAELADLKSDEEEIEAKVVVQRGRGRPVKATGAAETK
jgi:hypothetical protein